jgi:hypothetical protein
MSSRIQGILVCMRVASVPENKEGRGPKAHGLALKGGKSPADSPGFHAIPAWYREMQIGS